MNSPEPSRGALFDPTFGAGELSALLSDRAWVTAMVEVEGALARAEAKCDVIPAASADAISSVFARIVAEDSVDVGALGEAAAAGGNPVIPLVTLLRGEVAGAGVPGSHVHKGATSQDILDTALMLLCRRSGAHVLASLDEAALCAEALARAQRGTPIAGRTLGQQALPTTFGVLAAGWMTALHRASRAVFDAFDALPVQLGGAAGTSAALYPRGLDVADVLADELGLARQDVPWHTDRTRIALLASALGTAAGAVSKIATDIVFLSATEVGEVSEGTPGGSSAMPHKRNPVAAIAARAAARRVPGLVATILGSMDHEQQRAAGAWHAEWETLTDLLRLTGGAVARITDSLGGLNVHPDAMARNLDVTGGLLLAERVTGALSTRTDDARDLVTAACRSGHPLDEDPGLLEYLQADEIRALLDPAGYLGHAHDIVDRALDTVTRGREGTR
ncbi:MULTISPECIES: 3-carboxy-cis,cis-muconate cycloisomerase [unclassified Rhodococcus (in: high G+C Gram-positive bacteria)]|uniref:3-carboxy-cis,cis-muconate cycloisomerase n=1 Tax=unclassified Rhodococcus (in: high G+C Gram-positive bacteria) TaxID=192944 RepID=UPI001639D82E|nr:MULTISPECIES: 3-carboxy-cis,cis-muconate cycloisomerase [unclassified Rhodococcus (in: high G+C Gram-positive bacteria)]MBC2638782.1 3-carboxy-cis,cis-muconate cycloisomerase [Rhodococcus sp. 3A]MBC2896477.1 3-carboxy-cis,cis-muconate cycloisomerase [Rhodococcus sp. 4CII]